MTKHDFWKFEFSNELFISIYVTLEHKTSHKQRGYICSNNQKYTVWVKMIDFSFMPKIIRILSKDHVAWIYLVNFLPLIYQNLIFD